MVNLSPERRELDIIAGSLNPEAAQRAEDDAIEQTLAEWRNPEVLESLMTLAFAGDTTDERNETIAKEAAELLDTKWRGIIKQAFIQSLTEDEQHAITSVLSKRLDGWGKYGAAISLPGNIIVGSDEMEALCRRYNKCHK